MTQRLHTMVDGAGPPVKGSAGCQPAAAAAGCSSPARSCLPGSFLTNNVTFIAINGLVGLSLAPLGWTWPNLGSLLPIVLVAAALLWLVRRGGEAATARLTRAEPA